MITSTARRGTQAWRVRSSGLKVVELAGLGPAPFCAMLLADLGADVVRIDRPGSPEPGPADVTSRGRPSVRLDLRSADGVAAVLAMVAGADVLVEGFRPGVMERLGLGPAPCHAVNPAPRLRPHDRLGPARPARACGRPRHQLRRAGRRAARHRALARHPVPPLNFVGDYGGGAVLLAFGVMCALHESRTSGRGQVVDAAMTDGTALLSAMFYGLKAAGQWTSQRGENLLDGAAPFYDTRLRRRPLRRHRRAGAGFYALLRERCGIQDPLFDAQMDCRPLAHAEGAAGRRLPPARATNGVRCWKAPTPVSRRCSTGTRAPQHAHNLARETFVTVDGVVQPSPAPRFSRTPAGRRRPNCHRPAVCCVPGAWTNPWPRGLPPGPTSI